MTGSNRPPDERLPFYFVHDEAGEIDGLRFDFRHPDLDRENWRAPTGIGALRLKLPWSDSLVDTFAGIWPPDFEVRPGDTLLIDSVTSLEMPAADSFADPHDTTKKWVRVRLERPDGTTFRPVEPVEFVAMDAMGPESDYHRLGEDLNGELPDWDLGIRFDKIILRMLRMEDARDDEDVGPWLRLALSMYEKVDDWLERFPQAASSVAAQPNSLDYGPLLDMVATAAYALAQAEAEDRIAPLARLGAKNKLSLKLASEGARARSAPVREEALRDIAANPMTSQNACARRVAAKMGRDPSSVSKVIATLFEWRTLPGGAQEKRPKRP